MVIVRKLDIATKGHMDTVDLTAMVQKELEAAGLTDGLATVFVPGSTAGITSIEYEPGAIQDLKDAIARAVPEGLLYHHDARWGDGNGFSHVRAALLGASFTVPVIAGVLAMGPWQQIVLVDFDNRPRNRKLILQAVGE